MAHRNTQDNQKDKFLHTLGIKAIRVSILDLEEDYESFILHLEDIFRNRANEILES